MEKLIKKIKVTYTIKLITGLHIGGSKDSVEIGGVDNPVIKLAFDKEKPYIPGSSLKGKMRCLLEQIRGKELGKADDVSSVFGSSNTNNPQPSKIIVRDACLTDDSIKRLENCEGLDMPYTENKYENTIDRLKGTAANPRQTERVPAGVEFNAEFIINVWDTEEDGKKSMAMLNEGITALENDFLGGSGSRGYGQIQFNKLKEEPIQL